MWKAVLGRPDKPEESSSRRKDDTRSKRKSTGKEAESSRGDDRGIQPSSTAYSSSSRNPYPDPSVASSYQIAQTNNGGELIYPTSQSGTMRQGGTMHEEPRSRGIDDDKNSRRRDRSDSRDRERRRRDRSRSEERIRSDKKEKKLKRRSTDQTLVSGGSSRAIDDSTSRVSPAPMSNHVPDMFPGQFPSGATAPYRPPLAISEGGPGLAAEYYNDVGQSVQHQPGVRPESSIVPTNPQPHLMSASSSAHPPVEPSSSGQVGAAASFYGPGGNSSNSRPSDARPSNQYPPTSGSSVLPAVGAMAAAGAAAGYLMNQNSQSSTHQSMTMSQGRPSSNSYPSEPNGSSRPSRPGKQSSSSNIPYAAAAGAAGLAAGAYLNNQHHDHNNNSDSYSYGGNGTTMSQQQRESGPFSAIVNFFKDPEGVARFEEYSEITGVCRGCFEPGTTPRQAPRRHGFKSRRSNDRLRSSNRVDKDNRYYVSSGDENRRRSNKTLLGAAAAGVGLASVGRTLMGDFDDTYSVKSGKQVASSSTQRRSSQEYRQESYGVGEEKRSRRTEKKVEYGITSEGGVYKKTKPSNGSMSELITVEHEDSRQASRQESRDTHKLRDAVTAGAATGAIAGAALRRRSSDEIIRVKHRSRSGSSERRSRRRQPPVTSPSFFGSFFSSPSNGKKKRNRGFFNFSNGSSSSEGSLAFGASDRDYKRKTKRSSPKIKTAAEASAAIIGLGTAATALAAYEGRNKKSSRQSPSVIAVKSKVKDDRRRDARRHRAENEDGWESASEESDFSVDSALAFGSPFNRSRESLTESGTNKWDWRWGQTKRRFDSPKLAAPRTDSGAISPAAAGLAGVAAGVLAGSAIDSQGRRYESTTYDPVTGQRAYTSHPDAVPIQQPQAVAPVPEAVYAGRDQYGVPLDEKDYRRRDSNGVAYNQPKSPRNRDEGVRFDFTREQEARHRDEDRRNRTRSDRYDDEEEHRGRSRDDYEYVFEPVGTSERKGKAPKRDDADIILIEPGSSRPKMPDREITKEDLGDHYFEELQAELSKLRATKKPRFRDIAAAAVALESAKREGTEEKSNVKSGTPTKKKLGGGFAALVAAAAAAQKKEQAAKDENPKEPDNADDGRPDRKTTDRSAKVRIERSASPAAHESYASYFAPDDILSKPATTKETNPDPNADANITLGEHARGRYSEPMYPKIENEEFDPVESHRYLPWKVPRLIQINPTPPASRNPSAQPSPMIPPVEPTIAEESEEEESDRKGKPESAQQPIYEEIRPKDVVDEPVTPNKVASQDPGVAKSGKSQPDNTFPVEESQRTHVPGSFDDDIDFAATLAAGTAAAGFDPDIVIEDPTYRRRDSPPGSQSEGFYRQPYYQTVSDIGLEKPASRQSAQQGFVVGEVPDTPKQEIAQDNAEVTSGISKLSKKEQRKKDKAAKRQEPQEDVHDTAELDIIEDMARDTGTEPDTPGAKKSKTKSKSGGPSDSAYIAMAAAGGAVAAKTIESFSEPSPKPEEKKSKSKGGFDLASIAMAAATDASNSRPKDSRTVPDVRNGQLVNTRELDEPNNVPLPAGENDSFASSRTTKKEESRDEKDDETEEVYDSPSEYAASAYTAPIDEEGESRRHKKKKRRSKTFDDAASTVSSPAKIEDTKDSGKKKGGIFGLFGKSSSNESNDKRSPKETPDDLVEQFEEPKKKKKSRKSRDGDDFYSVASQSAGDLSKLDEDEDDDDRKSRRRRSRKGTQDEDDLGREAQDQTYKKYDTMDGDDKLPSQQSFLGERREKPKPPDIDTAYDDSSGVDPGSIRRSSSSPPLSRSSTPPKIDWTGGDAFTPEAKDGRPRGLSMVQGSSYSPATPSPTAIPLVFRRPGGSNKSSPAASTTSLSTPKSRKSRPQSVEFRSNEFRPLWLVTQYQPKQEIDPEEVLPSLPSSSSNSRSSSVHEDDSTSFKDAPETPQNKFKGKTLDLDAVENLPIDVLDSEQTTPTAATYRAKREQDLLDQSRQEAVAREIEWKQKNSPEAKRRSQETPLKDASPSAFGDLGLAAAAGGFAALALKSNLDNHDAEDPEYRSLDNVEVQRAETGEAAQPLPATARNIYHVDLDKPSTESTEVYAEPSVVLEEQPSIHSGPDTREVDNATMPILVQDGHEAQDECLAIPAKKTKKKKSRKGLSLYDDELPSESPLTIDSNDEISESRNGLEIETATIEHGDPVEHTVDHESAGLPDSGNDSRDIDTSAVFLPEAGYQSTQEFQSTVPQDDRVMFEASPTSRQDKKKARESKSPLDSSVVGEALDQATAPEEPAEQSTFILPGEAAQADDEWAMPVTGKKKGKKGKGKRASQSFDDESNAKIEIMPESMGAEASRKEAITPSSTANDPAAAENVPRELEIGSEPSNAEQGVDDWNYSKKSKKNKKAKAAAIIAAAGVATMAGADSLAGRDQEAEQETASEPVITAEPESMLEADQLDDDEWSSTSSKKSKKSKKGKRRSLLLEDSTNLDEPRPDTTIAETFEGEEYAAPKTPKSEKRKSVSFLDDPVSHIHYEKPPHNEHVDEAVSGKVSQDLDLDSEVLIAENVPLPGESSNETEALVERPEMIVGLPPSTSESWMVEAASQAEGFDRDAIDSSNIVSTDKPPTESLNRKHAVDEQAEANEYAAFQDAEEGAPVATETSESVRAVHQVPWGATSDIQDEQTELSRPKIVESALSTDEHIGPEENVAADQAARDENPIESLITDEAEPIPEQGWSIGKSKNKKQKRKKNQSSAWDEELPSEPIDLNASSTPESNHERNASAASATATAAAVAIGTVLASEAFGDQGLTRTSSRGEEHITDERAQSFATEGNPSIESIIAEGDHVSAVPTNPVFHVDEIADNAIEPADEQARDTLDEQDQQAETWSSDKRKKKGKKLKRQSTAWDEATTQDNPAVREASAESAVSTDRIRSASEQAVLGEDVAAKDNDLEGMSYKTTPALATLVVDSPQEFMDSSSSREVEAEPFEPAALSKKDKKKKKKRQSSMSWEDELLAESSQAKGAFQEAAPEEFTSIEAEASVGANKEEITKDLPGADTAAQHAPVDDDGEWPSLPSTKSKPKKGKRKDKFVLDTDNVLVDNVEALSDRQNPAQAHEQELARPSEATVTEYPLREIVDDNQDPIDTPMEDDDWTSNSTSKKGKRKKKRQSIAWDDSVPEAVEASELPLESAPKIVSIIEPSMGNTPETPAEQTMSNKDSVELEQVRVPVNDVEQLQEDDWSTPSTSKKKDKKKRKSLVMYKGDFGEPPQQEDQARMPDATNESEAHNEAAALLHDGTSQEIAGDEKLADNKAANESAKDIVDTEEFGFTRKPSKKEKRKKKAQALSWEEEPSTPLEEATESRTIDQDGPLSLLSRDTDKADLGDSYKREKGVGTNETILTAESNVVLPDNEASIVEDDWAPATKKSKRKDKKNRQSLPWEDTPTDTTDSILPDITNEGSDSTRLVDETEISRANIVDSLADSEPAAIMLDAGFEQNTAPDQEEWASISKKGKKKSKKNRQSFAFEDEQLRSPIQDSLTTSTDFAEPEHDISITERRQLSEFDTVDKPQNEIVAETPASGADLATVEKDEWATPSKKSRKKDKKAKNQIVEDISPESGPESFGVEVQEEPDTADEPVHFKIDQEQQPLESDVQATAKMSTSEPTKHVNESAVDDDFISTTLKGEKIEQNKQVSAGESEGQLDVVPIIDVKEHAQEAHDSKQQADSSVFDLSASPTQTAGTQKDQPLEEPITELSLPPKEEYELSQHNEQASIMSAADETLKTENVEPSQAAIHQIEELILHGHEEPAQKDIVPEGESSWVSSKKSKKNKKKQQPLAIENNGDYDGLNLESAIGDTVEPEVTVLTENQMYETRSAREPVEDVSLMAPEPMSAAAEEDSIWQPKSKKGKKKKRQSTAWDEAEASRDAIDNEHAPDTGIQSATQSTNAFEGVVAPEVRTEDGFSETIKSEDASEARDEPVGNESMPEPEWSQQHGDVDSMIPVPEQEVDDWMPTKKKKGKKSKSKSGTLDTNLEETNEFEAIQPRDRKIIESISATPDVEDEWALPSKSKKGKRQSKQQEDFFDEPEQPSEVVRHEKPLEDLDADSKHRVMEPADNLHEGTNQPHDAVEDIAMLGLGTAGIAAAEALTLQKHESSRDLNDEQDRDTPLERSKESKKSKDMDADEAISFPIDESRRGEYDTPTRIEPEQPHQDFQQLEPGRELGEDEWAVPVKRKSKKGKKASKTADFSEPPSNALSENIEDEQEPTPIFDEAIVDEPADLRDITDEAVIANEQDEPDGAWNVGSFKQKKSRKSKRTSQTAKTLLDEPTPVAASRSVDDYDLAVPQSQDHRPLEEESQPRNIEPAIELEDNEDSWAVPVSKKDKKNKRELTQQHRFEQYDTHSPAEERRALAVLERDDPVEPNTVQYEGNSDVPIKKFERKSAREGTWQWPAEEHETEHESSQSLSVGEKRAIDVAHDSAKEESTASKVVRSASKVGAGIAMFEGMHRAKSISEDQPPKKSSKKRETSGSFDPVLENEPQHHNHSARDISEIHPAFRDSGLQLDSPILPAQRDSIRDSGFHSDPDRGIDVAIEVNPHYNVKVSSPTNVHTSVNPMVEEPELPSSHGRHLSPERHHNEPSPVDATSRERAAALFSSSPSTRHELHHGQRSLEHLRSTSPAVHERSIFGGAPIGHSSDRNVENLRSPPRTPTNFGTPSKPLTTIDETSPDEQHKHTQPISQGEHKLHRRSGIHRVKSPNGDNPRRLGLISTDDLISRLSWPEVDDEHQALDLDRSITRNRDQKPKPQLSIDPNRPERRSTSGNSVESNDSITALIKSPPPTSTPPLRRSKRSLSAELSSKRQEPVVIAAIDTRPNLYEEENNTRNLEGLASSSTYDPSKDKIKGRIAEMADVYEGHGSGMNSPHSPTRPQSIRRRQSMQILDLETRLDQLVSENRLLLDAKNRAERSLELNASDTQQHTQALQDALQTRDQYLQEKDQELAQLKETLQSLQDEVSRLGETNRDLDLNEGESWQQRYNTLIGEHEATREQLNDQTEELEALKDKHTSLSGGYEAIVANEVRLALQSKDAELESMREELESAKQQVRALQRDILAAQRGNEDLVERDEDYFEQACLDLCKHLSQFILRFSKFSDMRRCRRMEEVQDEKITDRFDVAVLDGTDVDVYLQDRIRRRDIFTSVTMSIMWEYIFTRYLFGMDREQRSKLKALEKTLSEVGTPAAVARWRATTLSMLAKREAFQAQREQDTEAVVQEILRNLAAFLPPPANLLSQVQESLHKIVSMAVDLSIDLRTQKQEYIMLPPIQPQYNLNGDLENYVYFNASSMSEKSGKYEDNAALEEEQAVVRVVVFPLVTKNDGNEQEVICPAQVLVAWEDSNEGNPGRAARGMSAQGNRSVQSFAPSQMEGGMI